VRRDHDSRTLPPIDRESVESGDAALAREGPGEEDVGVAGGDLIVSVLKALLHVLKYTGLSVVELTVFRIAVVHTRLCSRSTPHRNTPYYDW